MYTFLDGFSGYNKVKMAPQDRDKTAFITEWGVFVATVMMFRLKNAPATFQRMVQEIFYNLPKDGARNLLRLPNRLHEGICR